MVSRGQNGGFGAIEEFVCQAIPGRPMTERAQTVMRLAREQAQRLGSGMIEPEHVLLALAEEGQGIAARVLYKVGVRPEQLAEAIQALSPQAGATVNSMGRSADTSRVLMAAQDDEAGMPVHDCVDTEHLLLAIVGL